MIESVKKQEFSNRTFFWIIILASVVLVLIMFGVSAAYQEQNRSIEATKIAIPTMTAEALEAHYQKGLANINIGRWQDAKSELDFVFEINPNYKDVQTKLIEVETKLVELKPTPLSTNTPGVYSPQPGTTLLSEQFASISLGKDWIILKENPGTISINQGILSLVGGSHKRINTRQTFSPISKGISTKARISFNGDYQKYGFDVNAEQNTSPAVGFYFDTLSRFDPSAGRENAIYLLVIEKPNTEADVTFIHKEQVPVRWNEFHEFEIIWANSTVSFYIDDTLQATVLYTFSGVLPVGIWNDRSQLMKVDWVEIQEKSIVN